MKEFFFSQDDNTIFNQDLKLAKFWRELKPADRTKFWRKVSDAQEGLITEIKESETFKKMKHIEDIQEETETETENNSSSNGMTLTNRIRSSTR